MGLKEQVASLLAHKQAGEHSDELARRLDDMSADMAKVKAEMADTKEAVEMLIGMLSPKDKSHDDTHIPAARTVVAAPSKSEMRKAAKAEKVEKNINRVSSVTADYRSSDISDLAKMTQLADSGGMYYSPSTGKVVRIGMLGVRGDRFGLPVRAAQAIYKGTKSREIVMHMSRAILMRGGWGNLSDNARAVMHRPSVIKFLNLLVEMARTDPNGNRVFNLEDVQRNGDGIIARGTIWTLLSPLRDAGVITYGGSSRPLYQRPDADADIQLTGYITLSPTFPVGEPEATRH